MLGGYMGRLSRRIIKSYQADPFMRVLLDLEDEESHQSPAMPSDGARAITDFSFRYVLVYANSTRPEVVQFVTKSLPLEELGSDGDIRLYRVKDGRSGSTL